MKLICWDHIECRWPHCWYGRVPDAVTKMSVMDLILMANDHIISSHISHRDHVPDGTTEMAEKYSRFSTNGILNVYDHIGQHDLRWPKKHDVGILYKPRPDFVRWSTRKPQFNFEQNRMSFVWDFEPKCMEKPCFRRFWFIEGALQVQIRPESKCIRFII